MACLRQKIAVGGAAVTFLGSGAIAILGSETVILTVAAGAVAVGAYASYIAALMDLAECLEAAGRAEDAARVRQDAAEHQQDYDRLRDFVGA
jgi:hypothetical protein